MHAHDIAGHTHNPHAEDAHQKQQRNVGLTTALIAVVLAVATMKANDANTRKLVDETKTADWWEYSAFHDTNARLYMSDATLAQAEGHADAAQNFQQLSDEQKKESDQARSSAQGLEYDSAVQSRHAASAELAELALEVSIVLCSVSLLSGLKLFWRLSFLSSLAGAWLILSVYLH